MNESRRLYRGLKYTLYFLNVVFFIVGVASVAVGIFVLIDESNLTRLFIEDTSDDTGLLGNACILLITIGCVLIIMAFIGCCGAMKEIKCFLFLYACILGFLIVLQLTAVILAVVFKDQLNESLEASLIERLNQTYTNLYESMDPFTRGYDYAMVYFECCGIRNYTEFQDRSKVSKWVHFHSQIIPAHCCKMDREMFFNENLPKPDDMSCPTTLRSSNIDQPCYERLENWAAEKSNILIIIALVVLFFQVASIILACCYMRRINETKDTLQ